VERVRTAVEEGQLDEPVVVVLEGAARGGVEEGLAAGVTVIHAPGGGDDMLVSVIADATGPVTLVTADRALRERARVLGAGVAGPGWFLELLEP
jgi:rRNA-processing protein FCF1